MLLDAREVNDWLKDMSWLPKTEKLDLKRASEYPPVVRPLAKQVARVVLTLTWRRTETSMWRARPINTIYRHVPILNDSPSSISLTIKVLCSVRVGVKRGLRHDNNTDEYICLWR